MSWRKSAGVYSAIIVGTLVAGEILARAYDWKPRFWESSVGDSLGRARYYHSAAGVGDLVPNQDGHWVIWFHRPYHVQTNSVGLRNVEEASAKAFRILALGDSQTFGPYLANEDTWPSWTENYLRQRYDDAERVQVFNAGISGYTILDELALLREKGLDFKPSLVLLGVYENDLPDLLRAKGQRPPPDIGSTVANLVKATARGFALASIANDVKSRIQLAAAGVDIRVGERGAAAPRDRSLDHDVTVRRYGELFRELVALLKSRNIPLAVVFIAPPETLFDGQFSQMEPVIAALTRETETPYLDLTLAMRNQPDATARLFLLQRDVAKKQLVGNGHLSREGNAAIGNAIATWLVEAKLVPN